MVWIFGGGNIAGANSIAPNDGRFFARDGVVLVAMNYRLGAARLLRPSGADEGRPARRAARPTTD